MANKPVPPLCKICTRASTVEVEGVRYCKFHDPSARIAAAQERALHQAWADEQDLPVEDRLIRNALLADHETPVTGKGRAAALMIAALYGGLQ